jgi:hypothetical protein
MEQEHLNNVFGARLRITTLRAAKGPGVELLEYLAPTDGRPYPANSHANDLWHWQTVYTTSGIDDGAALLREFHGAMISSGIVTDAHWGSSLAVRDPDGHALILTTSLENRAHP